MGTPLSPTGDPWSALYSQSVASGPSNTEDAGWTVDGPDKSMGVQLKGLSIARGGKEILQVSPRSNGHNLSLRYSSHISSILITPNPTQLRSISL